MRRTAGKRFIAGLAVFALAIVAQRAFGTKTFVIDGVLAAAVGALLLRYAVVEEQTPLPASPPRGERRLPRWFARFSLPKRLARFPLLRRLAPFPLPFREGGEGVRSAGGAVVRSILPLVVAAFVLNAIALVTMRGAIIPVPAVVLVLASVGLALVAAALLDRVRGITPVGGIPRWELAAVGGLTLLALALRLASLEQIPFGVWYDESNTALRVREAFAKGDLLVFFGDDTFRPVHMYSYAVSIALFGSSMFAIRLPEAIAGTLSVPAFYLAGRRLFGPQVGIVAAALVATARWHLTFSRIGFDGIWVPLLIALAVYFTARGAARRSALDYALAGVVVGFGLYSYIPFRVFPFVLAAFAIHLAVSAYFSERGVGSGQRAVGSGQWAVGSEQEPALPLPFREGGEGVRSGAAGGGPNPQPPTPNPFAERLVGLAVLGAVALLVASPFLFFIAAHPKEFGSRTETASVFSNKNTPAATQAALIENVRKHLLMFNVTGDPNGRHNLPGEPMLDPLTAGLFAVGVLYALIRINRPAYALLILNLAVMMLGGILSVDFEAPQSLRAIGTMASAYLLAAVPLGRLWELILGRRGDAETRRRGDAAVPSAANLPVSPSPVLSASPRLPVSPSPVLSASPRPFVSASLRPRVAASGAVVAVVLLLIARDNATGYFVRQANSFSSWAVHSTAETTIAYRLRELRGADADIFVSNLYSGHPSIRWLTPDAPPYKVWDIATGLPLRTERQEVDIFLEPQQKGTFAQLRAYYPTAKLEEVTVPGSKDPPVLYAARLTKSDLASIQGLEVRYFRGQAASGEPAARGRIADLDVAWKDAPPLLEAPFTAELVGTLYAPDFGSYSFRLEGAPAEVTIDESPALSATQTSRQLTLAKGNHNIRLVATVADRSSRTAVQWQRPNTPAQAVSANYLYVPPVVTSGLLGRYYRTPDWSGAPAIEQVDPMVAFYFHVTPLPRPYSVEWTGKLFAPRTGRYQLGTEQISSAQILLDDKLLIENTTGNLLKMAPVDLTEGYHDIKVRFLDKDGYSHVYLQWQQPGGAPEMLPSAYLVPPQAKYPAKPFALTLPPPPVPLPVPAAAAPAKPGQPGQPLAPAQQPPAAQPAGALQVPAVAALQPDTVIGGPGNADGQFSNPRGLAVGPDGAIYVVDTANFRIQKFDQAGKFQRAWGGQGDGDGQFQEPVSIVISSRGELLVLDNANGWIQKFDGDGKFLGKLAGPPAALYRPRGLAIDKADNLYISDTGGSKIVVLGPDGNIVRSIGTPGTGPGQLKEPTDILVLPDGGLLVLDTGNGRMQRLDGEGKFQNEWRIGPNVAAEGPHIAQALDGAVFVTDPERHRVIQFDVGLSPRAAFGGEGTAPGQFRKPIGVAVDRQGTLYVVDTLNNRVQRFKR